MSAIKQKGFTLIEMMITVVVIAILTAIALPSYNEHVRRSVRTKAQSYLSDLAQRQELRFQNVRSYTDVSTDLIPVVPPDVLIYYQAPVIVCVPVTCVPAAGDPASFTITIAPQATGPVSDEGAVTITSQGVTTWIDRHSATKQWSER